MINVWKIVKGCTISQILHLCLPGQYFFVNRGIPLVTWELVPSIVGIIHLWLPGNWSPV